MGGLAAAAAVVVLLHDDCLHLLLYVIEPSCI